MTVLASYIAAVVHLAPGSYPWTGADLTAKETLAVTMALKTHSRHKPRTVVEDESGTGAFDYAITALAKWSDEFSTIRQIEYPVDDTDEAADILEDGDWTIYEKPTGKVIRFLADKPATGKSFRVTYTGVHDFSGAASACTVAAFDEEAVQALAAANFCKMLSVYYSQNQDSTIAADSVDHKSKAAEYRSQARMLAAVYYDHMGIKEGQPRPASLNQDQDVDYPGGADRLTHPRRHR